MSMNYARIKYAGIVLVAVVLLAFAWYTGRKVDRADVQVRRLADELDRRTTDAGVYIRPEERDVQEEDPWGKPIEVTYSQGGIAEVLVVRSAGPDRTFDTEDDIRERRIAANLKGIGTGIRDNAERTAANVAKGVVKGTVQGVKETIKESLPRKRKAAAAEPKPAAAPSGS